MASIGIPDILIYLTDSTGLNFYSATLQKDGSYFFNLPTPTPTPILNLPINWNEAEIDWSRHPEYLGLFRSESENFTFVKDARAILLNLFYASGGGIQAECQMRIDVFVDVRIGYKTAYISDINFFTPDDKKFNVGSNSYNPTREGEFEVGTLDSKLFSLLQAFGNTVYNYPIWKSTGVDTWELNGDVKFIVHDGIKLLYSATFISSASAQNPLTIFSEGFHGGKHGDLSSPRGQHNLPSMSQYNIVQNNGTTTFVGNDILNALILQGNQGQFLAEENFANGNNSRPYSRNQYLLKDLLGWAPLTPDFIPTRTVRISVECSGTFYSGITYTNNGSDVSFVGFVLFEIDEFDNPYMPTGDYQYTSIGLYNLPIIPGGGSDIYFPPVSDFVFSTTIDMKFNKVYVFSIVYDDYAGSLGEGTAFANAFSDLKCRFFSRYTSGLGAPIDAPSLPPSVFPAIRLNDILGKLVPYLDTTSTDEQGFPIVIEPSEFSGNSIFLSDSTLPPIGDLVPYDVMLTSAYCMHNLQGQSYISISLNQFFNFCKKQLGCGLSIKPNKVELEIEDLGKYFQNVEIFALGTNVSKMSIIPFNDFAGCNLKLGYSKADTNTDFGVDPFITELYFNTPLTKATQTLDYEESSILCEQYAIEKIRVQQVSQPIGTSYDPSNPSSNNQCVAFSCISAPTLSLPDGEYYNFTPYDPSNAAFPCSAFQLTQRTGVNLPTPQATDPSAVSHPYIYGMYYPDTAINLELSPCRALRRDGGRLLHSVLDLMDDESLVFRNTSVMQFNNKVIGLSGIQSNLDVGSGLSGLVTEFKDIPISSLPSKLFRPFIMKIETVSPVNMWETMNTNPNGYISLIWKGQIWKGFPWKIKQKLSVSKPTYFELILHPDITNEQLINA